MVGCISTPEYPYRAMPELDPKIEAIPLEVTLPQYPKYAAYNNISGWVHFELFIKEDGSAHKIKVLDSHPEDIFVRSALNEIKNWKFEASSTTQAYQYLIEFKTEKKYPH